MTMTKEEINATFTNIMKNIETLSLELGNDISISYSAGHKSTNIFLHDPNDATVTSHIYVMDDDKEAFSDEPGMLVSTFSLDYCIERERRMDEMFKSLEEHANA
jgi:hypothetical protein